MKCSQRRSQKTCQVNDLINKYADDNVISVDSGSGGPPGGLSFSCREGWNHNVLEEQGKVRR